MMSEDDPRLTSSERAALERCLISERKGGEGWHRDSSAYAQVQAILDAGETRTPDEVALLETAQKLETRAARSIERKAG